MVGHALHFAHLAVDEAGAPLRIVHRDVSPQNVLVSRSGDVKLSDFGIAFAEGRAEKTVGGIARGKPAYMAPEQAVGGAMDGRTDVFGLGCVLHALLAGESALRDENSLVDLLAGVELTLDPSLPAPIREVIAKATRRNKAERYDTAEAMALACTHVLPGFLSGEPRTALSAWVKAVSPVINRSLSTLPTPTAKRPRRWPLVATLAITLVSAVTVSLARRGAVEAGRSDKRSTALDSSPPLLKPDESKPSPPPVEPVPEVKRAPKRPSLSPTPPQGSGVLTIGGERLLRGEVFVDGSSRGFAPMRLELSPGPHRVEVIGRDGVKHGPRELTVSRQHTESSPLSWEE